MRAIGGYFELEFCRGEHYHKHAVKLSTARQCLEYILHARKYRKIYVPYYTCDVILEPIIKMGIQYEFYHINDALDPIFDRIMKDTEALLYTNYFGLKQSTVVRLSKKYNNLIIDNAQAFFAEPLENVDTFYSARKFLGVPDGAYLYINVKLEEEFPIYDPIVNMKCLLGRLTYSAEKYYDDFQKSEQFLSNLGIHQMSLISDSILSSLDYIKIIKKRRFNYMLLDQALKRVNKMNFNISKTKDVPLAYPFFTNLSEMRNFLICNKIYIPQYWKNVLEWIMDDAFIEKELVHNLYALPIDQRYGRNEMNHIIDCISLFNNITL